MQLVKVGAAILNQTPLDWAGNLARVLAAIRSAREEGVNILCLPELCLTGYGCEDAFHSAHTTQMAWLGLQEVVEASERMVICVGLPILFQNALFNCACIIADRHILGFVPKRFLAGDGIHYEPRWFKPWPADFVTSLEIESKPYPIGDLCFDINGIRIGLEICEDAWVANRPGAALALKGVDLILNPSASHFAFGKIEVRKRFVLEGSRAFSVSYVYANLVGNESGRAIFDGGALIASEGRLLASGPRFSFLDHHLTTAVVDIQATRMSRARSASHHPELGPTPVRSIKAHVVWQVPKLEALTPSQPNWESGPHVKEEEFVRAEALALYDYLRKSRSHGFVISLSGGADSAACATLVYLMGAVGLKEIGLNAFTAKLAYIESLAGATTPQELTAALLTTVYQASANSGEVTRSAARSIAAALGAVHHEFDIAPLVASYTTMLEHSLGRSLDWQTDDVALQNIQARVRSPGVWFLANLKNAILLATSNRSEAAVGYATMDGDTSGGLCPIGGIDKAWLRYWLQWMEDRGPHNLGPFPALHVINAQTPTAELRPAAQKQTDEDDLMPYTILDAIERAAIRDKRSPIEVFDILRVHHGQHGIDALHQWVIRFFRLWSRNQWKRERYAPGFHLDDENLDPKSWCRWPILSGNFAIELDRLSHHVAHLKAEAPTSR